MGGLGPNDKLEIETKGAKDERVKSYAKLVISCHCPVEEPPIQLCKETDRGRDCIVKCP